MRVANSLRRRIIVYGLMLVAAGTVAYSNSFTSLFVGLDAKESIRDNPHIRTLWPLTSAMSLDLLSDTASADDGSKGGTVVRRPLLSLSFALNHRLLGSGAEGFHAVNLAIHLAAALLLFGIARRLLASFAPPRATDLGFAIALLWLLHPLQTESVTYLVQRAESLMGAFYLATLYAALRYFDGGRVVWATMAVVTCALGMGTKETMVTAPLAVLLCDAVFRSPTPAAALRARPWFYSALTATWSVIAVLILWTAEDAAKDFREGRTLAYALSQPGAILHYLRLALWPDDLHLYVNTYAFEFRRGASSLLTLAAQTLAVAALLVLALRQLWNRRPSGFVGIWFFLLLAPTSSIVATSDVVQEHRLYLSLASVVAIAVMTTNTALRTWLQPRSAAAIGVALCITVATAFGARTYMRNENYRSEFAAVYPRDLQEAYAILIDHALRVRAESEVADEARATLMHDRSTVAERAYADFALGIIAERNDADADAEVHFNRLVAIQPDLPHGLTQLGIVLQKQGKRAEAEAALRRAIAVEPAFASAHHELGVVLAATGRAKAARSSFERAIDLQPAYPEALLELAIWHANRGALDKASQTLESALGLRPDYAEAQHELGALLARMGDSSGAAVHLQRAAELLEGRLRQRRTSPQRHHELGLLYGELERRDKALAQFESALALDPDFAPAHVELGILARDAGDFETALRHLERAIELDPVAPEAHAEMGALQLERNDPAAAVAALRRAIEFDPAKADAIENLGVAQALLGDLVAAEKSLTRALELAPDRGRVRRRLEHVRGLRREQVPSRPAGDER